MLILYATDIYYFLNYSGEFRLFLALYVNITVVTAQLQNEVSKGQLPHLFKLMLLIYRRCNISTTFLKWPLLEIASNEK